jgi:hypothetical protein
MKRLPTSVHLGKRMGYKVALWLSVAALSGCANPGIVKLSPDTYMLSREAHGGIFASASALKAGVISDANAFAESQGKVAIPLIAKDTPMGNGPAQWARFEYQFRVVDKHDPEVKRTTLVPRADIVIEKSEKTSLDVKTKDQTERPKDFYAELIKLDDLRKREILTKDEFDVQKKRLLDGK